MTATSWVMAAALALGATTAASADIGISLGVGGRNGAFGFSYNQPYSGGYSGYQHRHYHGYPGYGHHGYYAPGWGVSVQAYQPAPRYYPPAYVYPQPRTVVVPPPVYVVPGYGY